jgi:hypothetical protein
MATFAGLEVNPTKMREAAASVFLVSKFTDQNLIDLKQELAKDEMKNDMRTTLRIIDEDSTLFDTYVTDYPLAFQQSLMWKQLSIYFNDWSTSGGGKNEGLYFTFEAAYKNARKSWTMNVISEDVVRTSRTTIRG